LQPYVVVAHCSGLAAGTYAYDARTHELVRSDDGSTSVLPVMRDAAASARMDADPQVLLVLCADYARMRGAYGDLGYGLLLKEVGAVMQTVQLVATAMGLASCPLGTGDSVAFARLAGVGPLVMPSVGELLLGAAVGAMEGGAEG
jgi:SagB-type dehydrogenase family enzyme